MNILLALLCLLAGSLLVVWVVLRDGLRSSALARQARILGFSFQSKARPFLGARVSAAPFLEDGPSTQVFNVISGSAEGLEFSIFDVYEHTLEMPLASSVAAFRWSAGALPSFELGSRRVLGGAKRDGLQVVFTREGSWSGLKVRVPADACPVDQVRLRAALGPWVSRLEDYRIASCPQWVFIMRPGRKVAASELMSFTEETAQLARAIVAGVGGRRASASTGVSG